MISYVNYDIIVYFMISYHQLWYHRQNCDITTSNAIHHRTISQLWYHSRDITVWYHRSNYDVTSKTVISHDPRFQMWTHLESWPLLHTEMIYLAEMSIYRVEPCYAISRYNFGSKSISRDDSGTSRYIFWPKRYSEIYHAHCSLSMG